MGREEIISLLEHYLAARTGLTAADVHPWARDAVDDALRDIEDEYALSRSDPQPEEPTP